MLPTFFESYLAPSPHQKPRLHHIQSNHPEASHFTQVIDKMEYPTLQTMFYPTSSPQNLFYSSKNEGSISPQGEGESYTSFVYSKKADCELAMSGISSSTQLSSEQQIKKLQSSDSSSNSNTKVGGSTKQHNLNQILKVIEKKTKTPRIYSTFYRRKKLSMRARCRQDLIISNEVVIFGNIAIDNNLSDNKVCFPSKTSSNLLQIVKQVKYYDQESLNAIKQESAIKNDISLANKSSDEKKKREEECYSSSILELELSTTHCNQLTNFKFLADHFKRTAQVKCSRLSTILVEYQKLIQNRVLPHIASTIRLLSDQSSFEGQMSVIFQTASEEIRKTISSISNSSSLFRYQIMKINFNTKQFDQITAGFNQNLLNLISGDSRFHNFSLNNFSQAHELLSFETHYNVQYRQEKTVQLLESLTKHQRNSTPVQVILKTTDGFDVEATASHEYLFADDLLDNCPSWMNYLDFVLIVVKYDVSQAQMSILNQKREQQLKQFGNQIYQNSDKLTDSTSMEQENQYIESSINSRLEFIKLYYPELMKSIDYSSKSKQIQSKQYL